MAKWSFNVDNEYAVIYKDGKVDWRMGPWDIKNNPDGPAIFASELCDYRNSNPDWDKPIQDMEPSE
jgi:hypothetical protein